MGKQSRRKRNKTRTKRRYPDEVFGRGPLKIERYGRFIRFSNQSTAEEQAEFLRRSAEVNTEVLNELELSIKDLQGLVRLHDPVELMNRAAYELLPLFMKYRSEGEYKLGETLFLPAVEYLQYLIARTDVSSENTELTEDNWKVIWGKAREVIKLTRDYLLTRGTSTNPPSELDMLRFVLDSRRLMVRVNRYPLFLKDHLEGSLAPYEAEIRDIYGTDVQSVVQALQQIADYQKFGILGRYKDMLLAQQALMLKLSEQGYATDANAPPAEVERTSAAIESPKFASLYQDVQQKSALALTPALFEITDLTNLPKPLLSLLSVKPGEAVLTQLTGPQHDDLSPLSTSVLHYKPFLEVNGHFYNFCHTGLEDRIAEIIEADLYQTRPAQVSEMAKKRSDRLEADAKTLMTSILRPDFAFTNVYYPNPDDPRGLTELDLLLGVDDVLVLVEAKAGGFSEAASRGALKSMERGLSDLIIEGQRQSERAERYIQSSDEAVFFDETGKSEVHRIRKEDYRKIFRVVITREELGWVGARIAALSMLDANLSKSYPWHVSIDDLRAVEELFRGDAVRFAHYLEQRLRASSEAALTQLDELDHIGLYNKLNRYETLPAEGLSLMSFDSSYMKDIDHYFMGRAAGGSPAVPTQEMPANIRQIVESLNRSGLPHRFEVASELLSFGAEGDAEVARSIDSLDLGVAEGRSGSVRMLITKMASGITITYASDSAWSEELKRSAVQMKRGGCQRWLVVQLTSGGQRQVTKIELLTPSRFSDAELAAELSRHEDTVRQAIQNQNPGRNSPCPCGSGKKFKKCHGAPTTD